MTTRHCFFRPFRPLTSQRRFIQRLRIFLDLDDCLVNTEQLFSESYNPSLLWKKIGIESTTIAISSEFKISYYCVALRPGLVSFLEEANQIGDLYVFTAGHRDYATAIVQKIDPEGKYIRRYWGKEMISWKYFIREFDYFYTKDLTKLREHFTSKRSVLIDNQIQNMIFQPQNGILSETSQVMQFGLPHLLKCEEHNLDPLSYTGPLTNSAGRPLHPEYNPLGVILGDLREMKDMEDVRPYLHDKYQIMSKLKFLSAKKVIPSPWSRHIESYDEKSLI